MATFELYVGGPATANYSRAMFPAPPFNAAAAPFVAMEPAAHKGPSTFVLTRVLDTKQHAMGEFLRENTLAQADVLGMVVIPQRTVLKGLYYEVVTPTGAPVSAPTTLTLTPSLRGVTGGTFPAIAGHTAGGFGFAKVGGTAWVNTNAAVEGDDFFMATPAMLDITLTAYTPASGLGNLKLIISPVLETVRDHGQY